MIQINLYKKKSPLKEKNKSLNKEYKIVLLSFLLTSILGTWITFYWQNRSLINNHKIESIKQEQKESQELLSELSHKMYSRFYIMKKLYWAYSDSLPKRDVKEQWKKYKLVLDDWNCNLDKNIILVDRYFGENNSKYLEFEIQKSFRDLGQKFYHLKKNKNSINLKSIKKDIDTLNTKICDFNRLLLSLIKDNLDPDIRIK